MSAVVSSISPSLPGPDASVMGPWLERLAAFAKWRRGTSLPLVVGPMLRLAVYPAGAVVFFVLMSRITTSHWFVSGGFYVPDPELQGRPTAVWDALVKEKNAGPGADPETWLVGRGRARLKAGQAPDARKDLKDALAAHPSGSNTDSQWRRVDTGGGLVMAAHYCTGC